MVIKLNKSLHIKRGFSLAEALVSMLILSMFFMATSKIITIKQKDEANVKTTGYYECYKTSDDKLHQKYSNSSLSEVATCEFIPPYTRPNKVLYSINNQCIYTTMELEISNTLTINPTQLTTTPSGATCNSYEQLEPCSRGECMQTSEGIDSFMAIVHDTYPTSSLNGFSKADYSNIPVVFIAW